MAHAVRRLCALALGALVAMLAQPAWAGGGGFVPNDDFSTPTVIGALPFSDTVDTTTATFAADDPAFTQCGNNGSVWYAVTATQDGTLHADTIGSDYDIIMSAYTGVRGALSLVACTDQFQGPNAQLGFQVRAGTTYFLMVALCCGTGLDGGGHLVLHVNSVVAPANDAFAGATVVQALPFHDAPDMTNATHEAGEPTCGAGFSATVWYQFTPATTQAYTARMPNFIIDAMAAYTGDSLGSLTQLACNVFQPTLTLTLHAGTTYRFQLGAQPGFGSPTFDLDVTPPPTAAFFVSPDQPSVFDTVSFFDQSFDPGGLGFQAASWSFGDGATAQGAAQHRYAADGDYTVRLDATTTDGRTASATRTLHVETHDVGIAKFTVPTSARAQATRSITVDISNTRYPETVQVQLFKSFPGQGGNFTLVGTLNNAVPVKREGKTTPFLFSYTFTDDDAAVGKVVFRAVATIPRDALQADNEVTATFTTVSPARSTGTAEAL